jgi:hypothetical protein
VAHRLVVPTAPAPSPSPDFGGGEMGILGVLRVLCARNTPLPFFPLPWGRGDGGMVTEKASTVNCGATPTFLGKKGVDYAL